MNEEYSFSGRINILRQALTSDKNKVAFLLGAGCPLSIRTQDGKPLIFDIAGLTKTVCDELEETKVQKLKDGIVLPEGKEATIEDILSRVRLLIDAIGASEFDGLKKQDLISIEKDICDNITQEVNKELPDEITSYHNLVSWISGIPRENPVEIFTPNYDLLVESALEAKTHPILTDLSASETLFLTCTQLNMKNSPRVGLDSGNCMVRLIGGLTLMAMFSEELLKNKDSDKQMIYPSHLKYSQSRRMPYLAMQDRLSNFLSTGQSVLITNGYSFVDQHLNEIITQRLSANPRSVCFGLLFDDIDKYPEALDCARKTTNLHLMAKDAAFFAGEQKRWDEKGDSQYNYLTEQVDSKVQCKVGDFASFCQFLLKQTGTFKMEGQDES